MDIIPFLNKINKFILNPIIKLAFAVALLVFFTGIVQFISSGTSDKGRDEGKRKILWGLFGMFIMISAYGLMYLVISTFGFDKPAYPGF